MAEISFNQADIDTNNDHIKKIEKQIDELNKKKENYQRKNRELKS